ncbi:MAG: protein kinase [Myxococcota bacterium]
MDPKLPKPIPFGPYLLLERLAIGGMAEVYLAKTQGAAGFEKLVAVKRILPTISEDSEFINMFIDEAKIAGQLAHASIAQIFDLGRINNSYYIAMEYVPGVDLRALWDRARARGGFPLPLAVHITTRICEGLDYAHRRKDSRGKPLAIVHRDVSPQNVLCSFDGDVKIIDFGIARAANRLVRTQTGILKGKFAYMAPEQARGQQMDHRADIFAIGVILHELITGERLFKADSDFSLLEKVRKAEFIPPRALRADTPPDLERVVMKALAAKPEDRYPWASNMQADLERYLVSSRKQPSREELAEYVRDHFPEGARLEQQRQQLFQRVSWEDAQKDADEARKQQPVKKGEGTVLFDTGEVEPLTGKVQSFMQPTETGDASDEHSEPTSIQSQAEDEEDEDQDEDERTGGRDDDDDGRGNTLVNQPAVDLDAVPPPEGARPGPRRPPTSGTAVDGRVPDEPPRKAKPARRSDTAIIQAPHDDGMTDPRMARGEFDDKPDVDSATLVGDGQTDPRQILPDDDDEDESEQLPTRQVASLSARKGEAPAPSFGNPRSEAGARKGETPPPSFGNPRSEGGARKADRPPTSVREASDKRPDRPPTSVREPSDKRPDRPPTSASAPVADKRPDEKRGPDPRRAPAGAPPIEDLPTMDGSEAAALQPSLEISVRRKLDEAVNALKATEVSIKTPARKEIRREEPVAPMRERSVAVEKSAAEVITDEQSFEGKKTGGTSGGRASLPAASASPVELVRTSAHKDLHSAPTGPAMTVGITRKQQVTTMLLALMGGLALGAATLILLQRTPLLGRGTLVVVGAMPEAKIQVDDGEAVPGPHAALVLPSGGHKLTITQDGYQPDIRQVELNPGEPLVVTFGGKPMSTALRITSNPSGALVKIDGKPRPGATPMVISDVEPGSVHELVLTHPDARMAKKQIKAIANEVYSVDVQMEFALTKITVAPQPDDAGVLWNNEFKGRGAVSIPRIPFGQKGTLRVTRPGCEPEQLEITPRGEEELTRSVTLTCKPMDSSVTLKEPAGARLFVDNMDTGLDLPVTDFKLPPGRYVFELVGGQKALKWQENLQAGAQELQPPG